jgi:hypothetical protein
VEEDGEETDGEGEWGETETTDTDGEGYGRSRKERERQQWREMLEKEAKEQGVVLPPPPEGSEEGGWGDAAWLLSVATKVLLWAYIELLILILMKGRFGGFIGI